MHTGLQTHFDALIDRQTLRAVRQRRYTLARMDAQACDAETLLAMIADARACDLHPFPIVRSLPKLRVGLPGDDREWGNEPDGDVDPELYRQELDEACRVALEAGVRLWAPAISNLDEDSLRWLNEVRDAGGGWPKGLHGISAHRYGNGSFEWAHPGFGGNRTHEVQWLMAACQGLPYAITEVGYPSADGLTEAQQAERMAQEWAFWMLFAPHERPWAVVHYQLNDGPYSGSAREESYGIRKPDGQGGWMWKPVADVVPGPIVPEIHEEHEPMSAVSETPLFTFNHACVIHNDDGTKSIRWDLAARKADATKDRVFSLQPDGRIEDRADTAIGPWEKGVVEGDRLVFRVEGARATFAWQA